MYLQQIRNATIFYIMAEKISGFYQMGLHPDYRKDLYEQLPELLAALYWMCTCCP